MHIHICTDPNYIVLLEYLFNLYINFRLPELDDQHLFNNNDISCQDGLIQYDRKRYDSQPAEAIIFPNTDIT